MSWSPWKRVPNRVFYPCMIHTAVFPLPSSGWRLEVGVNLPQMALLECKVYLSFCLPGDWLDCSQIQRAPGTGSWCLARGAGTGNCASGSCAQQSQVSPKGPGESQGRGDAAGHEYFIPSSHIAQAGAMPAGGSCGKGLAEVSCVPAFVFQRS